MKYVDDLDVLTAAHWPLKFTRDRGDIFQHQAPFYPSPFSANVRQLLHVVRLQQVRTEKRGK